MGTLIYIILFTTFSFFKAISQTTIIVDQSEKGQYTTVQAAIDYVPSGNSRWINIQINPGTYKERVTIPRDKGFIFLEGGGQNRTIITADGSGKQTNLTSTVFISSNDFVARGITFENTNYNPVEAEDDINSDFHPAVAVAVAGDRSSFHECGFVSYQDTLWDVGGRHYYNTCYIEGLVDFIWGAGQSVFEDCNINVRALPPKKTSGYITAQGRESSSDPGGFVFIRGHIGGHGLAFLGRAYRAFSRVIYLGTDMAGAVNPLGWYAWNYTGQEQNIFYAEASCSGVGADQAKRVLWEKKKLTNQQLQQFSRENFIDQDGWLDKQPRSLV